MEKIKYDTCEIMERNNITNKIKYKCTVTKKEFEKKFENRVVLDVKNYDDIEISSIIIAR